MYNRIHSYVKMWKVCAKYELLFLVFRISNSNIISTATQNIHINFFHYFNSFFAVQFTLILSWSQKYNNTIATSSYKCIYICLYKNKTSISQYLYKCTKNTILWAICFRYFDFNTHIYYVNYWHLKDQLSPFLVFCFFFFFIYSLWCYCLYIYYISKKVVRKLFNAFFLFVILTFRWDQV